MEKVRFSKAQWKNGRQQAFLEAIALGDVSGDKRADVAAMVTSSDGRGEWSTYLEVLCRQKAGFVPVAARLVDGGKVVRRVTIDRGKILLELIVHGPDDERYSPTLVKTVEFNLKGHSLVGPKDSLASLDEI